MTNIISKRELLIGGTALAGTLIAAKKTPAQTFPEPISNPTPQNFIRCGSNENVYGPSIKAQAAMDQAKDKAHFYNFRVIGQLKNVIAEMEGLTVDNIAMASGSSPFLEKAGYIARFDGGEVVSPYPTYSTVAGMAERLGSKVHNVPLDSDMEIDLDAMRAAMNDNVKVVYLCNPNNPIPTIIEKNKLRDFVLEMSQKALVVIDEAYYEYVDNPDFATMAPLVVDHPNIVVCRTASKIHAFAGIRVGFAFAHPDTLKLFTAPFDLSMNYMAMEGAIASYQDTEYQDFVKQKNKECLEIYYNVLDELGLEYIRSNSNFVFFNAKRPNPQIREELSAQGVEAARPFPPFMTWVRMSTVKPEEMTIVANALRQVLG